MRRSSVVVVAECKWRNRQLGLDVLEELEAYKIPALRQAKARLAKDLSIVLTTIRSSESISSWEIRVGPEGGS